MTTLGRGVYSVPTVSSATERDALFPSPETGQKVANLGTGNVERYTGAAWTAFVRGDGGVVLAFNVRGGADGGGAGGAVGDGVTNDRTAIALADTTAQTTTAAILFPPGTYLVSTSLTITSPVIMMPGATIKTAAGVSVTFVNFRDPGLQQHFDQALAAAWATSSVYTLGDFVSHNGLNYRCVSSHTAGSTTEPGKGKDWAAGTPVDWSQKWKVHPIAIFSDASVEYARPEWFGAKANSSTNSRVGFILAVASMSQSGLNSLGVPHAVGRVQLANGGYNIEAVTGEVRVPGNMVIRGSSRTRFGGTRIRHRSGDLLFMFGGVTCGTGAFEGGGLEQLMIDNGFGAAGCILVHRSNCLFQEVGSEEWNGGKFIELDDDPAGTTSGNPFNTHFKGLWINNFSSGGADLCEYGIYAKRDFNCCSIQWGYIQGCSIASTRLLHGSGWWIRDINLENNATAGAVGVWVDGARGGTIGPNIYGEKVAQSLVKVTNTRGLTIDLYADGGTSIFPVEIQRTVEIIDASGAGTNVRKVRIVGSLMERADTTDVYIEGTRSVILDCDLASSTPVTLGANGGYERRMPLTLSVADTTAATLNAADLGAVTGIVISITTGVAEMYAEVLLRGSDDAQIVHQMGSPAFSVTKDNAGTMNIYRDPVDSLYKLQNLTGDDHGVVIRVQHYHNLP